MQGPGRFLGIIGQNPGVSKSIWLHVCDLLVLVFPMLRCIPYGPLE